MEIVRTDESSRFIFAGLDDVEKLKSIQGITDVWIEEATEITQDDYQQLNLRLRGGTLSKQIIMSFNPVSALSWIKRYFFDEPDEDKVSILKTTYKHNRWLDAEYIAEIVPRGQKFRFVLAGSTSPDLNVFFNQGAGA